MENEYISRKELIVWLMPYVHTGEKVDPEALIADIRAMKAADVVPVVRCRDCKHYVKGSCNAHSVWPDEYSTGYDCRPDDDDFCSYGERKED